MAVGDKKLPSRREVTMKRYLKIWYLLTAGSFQTILASRFAVVVFIFGKLLRFGLYLAFMVFLFSGVKTVLIFDQYQTLLFLMTFTILGSVGQMLFREVYRFRGKLTSGEFDFDLVKPIHPLLKNMTGGFDLMDLLTMPVLFYALYYVISHLQFTPSLLVLYFLLCLNGLLVLASIHIILAGLGIITLEIDHMMMIYRDIETMGRFPVDIYKEPLRQILTFAVPVGIMFTIPAKALLGLLSWPAITASFLVGLASIILAFKFWDFAVKKYSSASS